MKILFAILLLMIGVCVACEIRPTSSQTPQYSTSVTGPSPAQPSSAAVSDSAPCSLVKDQLPVIKGIRLGMTQDEVLALFPGSKEDPEIPSSSTPSANRFGTSSFLIKPDKYGSHEEFAAFSQMTFSLLDGRVSSFYVGYNGPEWPNVDQFLAKVIEGTNLPAAEAWEPYVGLDTSLKSLRCKDFEIQAFIGGKGGILNYVQIRDLEADRILKDRKDKDRKDKASQKATP